MAQPGPSRAFLNSLHPSGDPGAILWVADEDAQPRIAKKAAVAVLAMSPADCRDARRLQEMIGRALFTLAPDGVLWVDAPGQWLTAIRSALRARGMTTSAFFVRRARGAGEAQVALTPRAIGFGLKRGHLSRRWRWVQAALGLPFGRTLLARFLSGVGFAAFRSGTSPFGWLSDRFTGDRAVDVTVLTSWRGEGAPYLIFGLGARGTLVAKRGGAESRAQIVHETEMLRLLQSQLSDCGLEVPRLLDSHSTATTSTLIESAVAGTPLASLIGGGHHRDLGGIADRLAEWLACWNSRTLRHVELTKDLAERLIISAARPLVGSLDCGSPYLKWLSREVARLVGSQVPLVAAHNDLTMANVLGDRAGICSIVDWEAASPDGLPLTDFRYAVCDAAAAIGGTDRLAAFRACFLEDGQFRARLQESEALLRAIASGPPGWLELCVHAGWVRHAVNEQARTSSSRFDRSFLAIANLLADRAVDH